MFTVRPQARPPQKSGFSGVASAEDPDRLGWRAIGGQMRQDLFLTKDVQDNPTGTYVWLADQIGHLALGLMAAELVCWVLPMLGRWWGHPSWSHAGGPVALLVVLVLGALIERGGVKAATQRASKALFPLDTADLQWNATTTMVYFIIGGLLGASGFYGVAELFCVLVVSLWPAVMVGQWWMRRHMAFQQAGAPYLYRLANFGGTFSNSGSVPVIQDFTSFTNQKVSFWHVLFDWPKNIPPKTLDARHLLVTGPLLCGKTSLAAGITTEFAFTLGTARFLSPVDLLEILVIPDNKAQKLVFEDGILLWKARECELIVVDDVDSAVTGPAPGGQDVAGLTRPAEFAQALCAAGNSAAPLAWLRDKRSVWVIGDVQGAQTWRQTLATLMGDPNLAFTIIDLV